MTPQHMCMVGMPPSRTPKGPAIVYWANNVLGTEASHEANPESVGKGLTKAVVQGEE